MMHQQLTSGDMMPKVYPPPLVSSDNPKPQLLIVTKVDQPKTSNPKMSHMEESVQTGGQKMKNALGHTESE